jgi:hypothetical protein
VSHGTGEGIEMEFLQIRHNAARNGTGGIGRLGTSGGRKKTKTKTNEVCIQTYEQSYQGPIICWWSRLRLRQRRRCSRVVPDSKRLGKQDKQTGLTMLTQHSQCTTAEIELIHTSSDTFTTTVVEAINMGADAQLRSANTWAFSHVTIENGRIFRTLKLS